MILDVGHNAGGVRAFVDSFQLKYPNRRATIIAGFVKLKQHQEMFDSLSPIARWFALVPLETKRSSSVRELLKTVDFRGIPARPFGSVGVAYDNVLKLSEPDDIVVIIGSHYLVGAFMKLKRL